jgi:hypothetical protein
MSLPFALIRFCQIGDNQCFFALRTKDSGEHWDIVYASEGDMDEELIESPDCVVALSFLEWLEDLHRRDGWPPLRTYPDDYSDFCLHAERIPSEEAVQAFGPAALSVPAFQDPR